MPSAGIIRKQLVYVGRENVSFANCTSQIVLKAFSKRASHRNSIFMQMICCLSFTSFDPVVSHQPDNLSNYFSSEDVNKDGRALFPRIEYNNEWQPVGRGDPLKDPTYDYMPPVLDRVRYWGEASSNKNKNDVLVLGVPSKKLSSIKQKEKFNYGPIKRTYYSPPYQHHFSPPLHHQQQQQQPHVGNNKFLFRFRF